MRFSNLAAISATAALVSVAAATDCDYVSGNYYCSETDAVVYSNVGYSGSYMDVTAMDESSCACTQEEVSFSGAMAPLDEELSVHFRGPLELLQFGVYYPSSGTSLKKRDSNDEDCSVVVQHQHRKREAAVAIVEVTSTVYVNGEGSVVTNTESATTSGAASVSTAVVVTSSLSPASALSSEASVAPSASAAASSSASAAASSSAEASSTVASSSAASTSSSSSSSAASGSGWERVSYYSPGSTTNCTFMNNEGGTAGSGTWSSCFGNSISYAASDGVSGASSAEALDQVTITSDEEYMIFSGVDCSDDSIGSCGYYRSDIPAYHGFGGKTKMFVFEFKMPHDYSSTTNEDMPAIWMLNAKIPRTLQYGDSTCSCWSTGCGELDLFEILSSGSEKLITHIHDGQGNDGTSSGGGGTQDYFTRPTSSSLKAAVIFDGSDETIHVLEVSGDFDSTLSASTVQDWLDQSGSSAALS